MTATKSPVSAVLFAKDARAVARFYVAVFAAVVRGEDEYHAALELGGFALVVQQIPAHIAADIEIGVPPVRREEGALRLDHRVADVASARAAAARLGGRIDEMPPRWAGTADDFFLGYDPEGNVFGVVARGG